MRIKFKIFPLYTAFQLRNKMIKEGWSYMYNSLTESGYYTITGFQKNQVMKINRYGERLVKL